MAWIKLNEVDFTAQQMRELEEIAVNTDLATKIEPRDTHGGVVTSFISFAGGASVKVRQSPDEILGLIREANRVQQS